MTSSNFFDLRVRATRGGLFAGRRDALVDHTDVLPTVLQMMGIAPAAEIEGRSFLDAVAGLPGPAQEPAVAEIYLGERAKATPADAVHDAIYAVRDAQWKLIVNPQHAYPRMPPYTSVPGTGFRIEPEELYDLLADPDELTNLAREPKHAATVKRLRAAAIAELKRTGAKMVDSLPPVAKLTGE